MSRPANSAIIALRKSGVGPRQIARDLGCSPCLVAGVLFRAGLTDGSSGRGRGNGANEHFKAAVLATAKNLSLSGAAQVWGVSRATIAAWAREADQCSA